MSEPIAITGENFDQLVLKATKPVLVDFWATWCGPCRMLSPIVDQIADETTSISVYKCNVDDNNDIAARYNVASIPTLILFKDGKPVITSVGAMPKDALKKKFEQYL